MKDDNLVQVSEAKNDGKNLIETQRKKSNVKTIIAVFIVAQIILSIFAGVHFFRSGYVNVKTNTTKRIRQDAYDTVYALTEGAHHTSNRAVIMLDEIKEKADLEVLQVSTSFLYTYDNADKANDQTIWYKIPGTGTFTVDLQMTEFIVDAERHHVLVKAPSPVITKFREGKAEELFYKNNRFISNGSIQEGEEIARKMLQDAHIEMINNLEGNTEYMKAAKESAQKLIASIIKSLNPSVKDLTVTVEFLHGK